MSKIPLYGHTGQPRRGWWDSGRDLVVCGHLHSRSHGADSPVRADLPSCNVHPFPEVRFHGASENQSRYPPPSKHGPSIMLPLFCFPSFSSLTSHLLNPAFTPDPLSSPPPHTHCPPPDSPGSGGKNPSQTSLHKQKECLASYNWEHKGASGFNHDCIWGLK